jgi:pyruvoyl-dependent arginine decarboxylase (PvlArgDC)
MNHIFEKKAVNNVDLSDLPSAFPPFWTTLHETDQLLDLSRGMLGRCALLTMRGTESSKKQHKNSLPHPNLKKDKNTGEIIKKAKLKIIKLVLNRW